MSRCEFLIGAFLLSSVIMLGASVSCPAADSELVAPVDSAENSRAVQSSKGGDGYGGLRLDVRDVTVPSDNSGIQPLPFKYIGNSFSSKFHRPSCPYAKCISSRHLVLFARRKDATDQKFLPCRYCLPPSWTEVHAIILSGTKKTESANGFSAHDNADGELQKSVEPAKKSDHKNESEDRTELEEHVP